MGQCKAGEVLERQARVRSGRGLLPLCVCYGNEEVKLRNDHKNPSSAFSRALPEDPCKNSVSVIQAQKQSSFDLLFR